MKTGSVIRESSTGWTESSMLKSIKEDIPDFGGDMHAKPCKVKVTIIVKQIK